MAIIDRDDATKPAHVRAADGRCRACDAVGLIPVLDLGRQPLANALRAPADLDRPEPVYPLDVAMCPSCSLLQLTYSVPPEQLFSDYPYFSSVIPSLVAHAREIAHRKIGELGLDSNSLAMEIA